MKNPPPPRPKANVYSPVKQWIALTFDADILLYKCIMLRYKYSFI